MPGERPADRKRHQRQRPFVDPAHLVIRITNAAPVVWAFFADHITAARKGNHRVVPLQMFDDPGHVPDKLLAVALALKEADTQRVMRSQKERLAHSLTTLERRFDRIIASAIFTPSGMRNGTTQSIKDSPIPIPVTTMNQIVPMR